MRIKLFVFLLLTVMQAYGQSKISTHTYSMVSGLGDSIRLADGALHVYNLFKIQVQVIYAYQDQPADIFRKAVIEKTYNPFRTFWEGYVGDSSVYFDHVILPLLTDSIHLIENRAQQLAGEGIDKTFRKTAKKIEKESGYYPKGKWYIAFGSGVTDLGGFGNGVMVLDLTHPKTTGSYITFILPHEMNHQIFDFTSKEDTTARGLYRCINEGLAVWVNQKLVGRKYDLQTYLQYTSDELQFCTENEAMIFTKLEPFLLTGDPDHAQALADRSQKIFKGGPGAIGYFLGYRICDAYVKSHGKDSWKDIYVLPVQQVLQESGYRP